MQNHFSSITVSNPTETTVKKLRQRAAYVAAHRTYLIYLLHLLDTATLPASTQAQPNLTSMAAMVQELRSLHPHMPNLNAIVFGRLLNRVLPSLLTWHGGQCPVRHLPRGILLILETTIYRFPEVGRARAAYERYTMRIVEWSNDHDQWQCTNCGDEQ